MHVQVKKGKRNVGDKTTQQLMKGNVYHIPGTEPSIEISEHDKEVFHGFWEGLKYIVFLSLVLWWLPIIGQAIAGYVGGKKSGSTFRAVMAALVPVDIILIINICLHVGWIPGDFWGAVYIPAAVTAFAQSSAPFLLPYIGLSGFYLSGYVGSIFSVSVLEPSLYLVVVGFAFIGGALYEYRRPVEAGASDRKRFSFRQVFGGGEPVEPEPVEQVIWTRVGTQGGSMNPLADADGPRGVGVNALEAASDDDDCEEPPKKKTKKKGTRKKRTVKAKQTAIQDPHELGEFGGPHSGVHEWQRV